VVTVEISEDRKKTLIYFAILSKLEDLEKLLADAYCKEAQEQPEIYQYQISEYETLLKEYE